MNYNVSLEKLQELIEFDPSLAHLIRLADIKNDLDKSGITYPIRFLKRFYPEYEDEDLAKRVKEYIKGRFTTKRHGEIVKFLNDLESMLIKLKYE